MLLEDGEGGGPVLLEDGVGGEFQISRFRLSKNIASYWSDLDQFLIFFSQILEEDSICCLLDENHQLYFLKYKILTC